MFFSLEEVLPSPTWQDSARQAMDQARRFAEIMNLAAIEFTVNLTEAKGTFEARWYDINAGRLFPPVRVEAGSVRTFTTPFPGPAALHLKLVE
jgi:hypothetical protein